MVDQPMVVVRGTASREVPPEQAVFTVSVSARDKDRQTTLTRLTERAAGLRALLDEHAEVIAKRETGRVQIYPELKRGSERVAAYTGSVATTVTVTDFAELGDLLIKLGNRDQTSVSGPWWQLKPGSDAGAEVRRDAIADALSRAREYAAAVGARVDRLVEITDEGLDGGGPRPMMMRAAAPGGFGATSAVDESLEIDPEQQTVAATVVVRVTVTEPTGLG